MSPISDTARQTAADIIRMLAGANDNGIGIDMEFEREMQSRIQDAIDASKIKSGITASPCGTLDGAMVPPSGPQLSWQEMADDFSDLWMQTYSGHAFSFTNPTEDMICIEDIAHHLSIENRFSGATRFPYSVGQHCVLASWYAPDGLKLSALMHDSTEAYLKDIPRPLKAIIGPVYKRLESNLYAVIARKFGLPAEIPKEVKEIDNRLLMTERRDLTIGTVKPWKIDEAKFEPYPEPIGSWSSDTTERAFLTTFKAYQG